MTPPTQHFLLGQLLKSVSRSFYLTLRVLPAGLREPIGIAYLLARAADTIADTSLISPEHRIELLLALRAQINGLDVGGDLSQIQDRIARQQNDSREGQLLAAIEPVMLLLHALEQKDRDAVRQVLSTLTAGMEFDLRRFPDERAARVSALDSLAELDRYTYMVAGCVGEFWTMMSCRHQPALSGWEVEEMSRCGVDFGKALQMVNILRDCGKDLRIGRCYLPLETLAEAGLTPEMLLQSSNSLAARPVLIALTHHTLALFREAMRYTLAIPRRCMRLRLACLWPILIGLETLACHLRNDAWLDPMRASRIGRGAVYRIVAVSIATGGSNTLVRRRIEGLISGIEAQLGN